MGTDDITSLFEAHYAELTRLAAHVLLRQDLAEDVVQDVFVRLSRMNGEKLSTIRKSYLRRAVMNGSLDMLRRKKVEARFFMLLRAVDATEDVYRDADLRAALALLAPRKRACVVLRYYCGCSLAEIADILGVSLGTVKSQLHKALRDLGREMRLEPSVEHAYPPESLADQTRRPHGCG